MGGGGHAAEQAWAAGDGAGVPEAGRLGTGAAGVEAGQAHGGWPTSRVWGSGHKEKEDNQKGEWVPVTKKFIPPSQIENLAISNQLVGISSSPKCHPQTKQPLDMLQCATMSLTCTTVDILSGLEQMVVSSSNQFLLILQKYKRA
jgi:hypothetical protein